MTLITLFYANIASKCNFLTAPEKKVLQSLKNIFPQIKRLENGFEKKFPDLKFFSLILAQNPLFSPDFSDWKKSSKISLIGGNPVHIYDFSYLLLKISRRS